MIKRKNAYLEGILTGLAGATCTTVALIFAIISFHEGNVSVPDFIRYLILVFFVIAFALFISIGLLFHKNHVAQVGGLSALAALPVALLIYNAPFLVNLPTLFEQNWSYAMGSVFDFLAAIVLVVAAGFLAYAAGNKASKAGQITIGLCQMGAGFFTTAFLFFIIADVISSGATTPALFTAAGTGLLVDGITAVLAIYFKQGADPSNYPKHLQ